MTDLSPRPETRASSQLAELHRLCREDYNSNAARREQNHRDDAHLIAATNEAVTQR